MSRTAATEEGRRRDEHTSRRKRFIEEPRYERSYDSGGRAAYDEEEESTYQRSSRYSGMRSDYYSERQRGNRYNSFGYRQGRMGGERNRKRRRVHRYHR